MRKRGYICIVFDDGFKTDLTIGLQEQLDRGMTPKGTSYIIGSAVENWYSGSTRMNADDCREILSHGWDLQDHSYHHYLTQFDGGGMENMTYAQLNEELDASDNLFRNVLGIYEPEHFSIPGGTLTKLMMDAIGARRKTIMVGGGKMITPYTNRLTVPSFDISTFNANIDKIIDDTVEFGLASVLYAHELSDATAVAQYRHVLDYGLASGAEFVNVRDLWELFNWKGYFEIGAGF